MSDASASEGAIVYIGTGDARTVADADDSFVEIGEVVSFSDLDGGDSAEIDVTHLQSVAKEYLLGLPDNGTFSMELNFIAGDAGQTAFRAARVARGLRNFRVVLPDDDGTTYVFKGRPKTSPVAGGVDQKLSTTMTVRISGGVGTA